MASLIARAEEIKARELTNIRTSLEPLALYLNDDAVNDIFVDEGGRVSIHRFGQSIIDVPVVITENNRIQILNQIAKWQDMLININDYPVIEGTIPIAEWNSRITGIFPPWVTSPTFTIRKPPKVVFTLEDYVKTGRLSGEHYNLIYNCIQKRQNLLISGGTGSGKTTLANACLKLMAEFSPEDRFYIVQDNAELQCMAKYATLVTIKREQAVRAVQLAMRWSPRRIIFGEVRDGQVMAELLDAWNTGHPGGLSTIHADTAESTFLRVRTLLRQKYAGELPAINGLVHLIVHLRADPEIGVRIDEVLETNKYSEDYIDSLVEEEEARASA